MLHIHDIVVRLLQEHKTKEICAKLEISQGMLSTWKNADNDFVPRKEVAARIQGVYGYTTWPYSNIALRGIWENMKDK